MPDFVTYCLQNTQNAVLDSLIFQNFPGEDAPGPPYKDASPALLRSTYDHWKIMPTPSPCDIIKPWEDFLDMQTTKALMKGRWYFSYNVVWVHSSYLNVSQLIINLHEEYKQR